MDLAIVIPVFNEAGNIASLLEEIDVVPGLRSGIEIIVVDDGSNDDTAAVLEARLIRTRRRGFSMVRARVTDGTTEVPVVWYNQPYLAGHLAPGRPVWLYGGLKPDKSGVLRMESPEVELAAPEVKQTLRDNTERACAVGVFGVPTSMVGGELFWGVDATEMLLDYLAAPESFVDAELGRVSELPSAAVRPQSR